MVSAGPQHIALAARYTCGLRDCDETQNKRGDKGKRRRKGGSGKCKAARGSMKDRCKPATLPT
jgi:hypothetical protein